MLRKKHDEAKEILVRAIVNNNKLLMLNHPLYDEKISFETLAVLSLLPFVLTVKIFGLHQPSLLKTFAWFRNLLRSLF